LQKSKTFVHINFTTRKINRTSWVKMDSSGSISLQRVDLLFGFLALIFTVGATAEFTRSNGRSNPYEPHPIKYEIDATKIAPPPSQPNLKQVPRFCGPGVPGLAGATREVSL
jgi:hypothetical protein